MLKEKLEALWAKVVENKEIVIRVGGVLAGAVVGILVTTVVANMQDQALIEEMLAEEDPDSPEIV